jgi:class 3 adenylate cyclase
MADSPTGTITFLITDIEGSTRMWERDPQAMSETLARHDEILFWALRGHSGEASRWLDRVLDKDDEGMPPSVRAKALNAAGAFAEMRNEHERGWALAGEAVAYALEERP